MEKATKALISLSLIAGLTATTALAGAPGPNTNLPMFTVMPVEHVTDIQPDNRPYLSPAEIRNAVEVQMDSLAQSGVEIDRSVVDGVGLNQPLDENLETESFADVRLISTVSTR